MKGQYRVVSEVLLFAIGIGIASFVIVQFNIIQEGAEINSFRDQMTGVLNSVMNSVHKAYSVNDPVSGKGNANVDFEIPETLSGKPYLISLIKNDESKLIVVSELDNPDVNVHREIFNIEDVNNVEGSVTSSSRFIRINYESNTIEIQRR